MEKIKKWYKEIAKLLYNIKIDRIGECSAQCAYYTILSFIPFIILLITLIQYTNRAGIQCQHTNDISNPRLHEKCTSTNKTIIFSKIVVNFNWDNCQTIIKIIKSLVFNTGNSSHMIVLIAKFFIHKSLF